MQQYGSAGVAAAAAAAVAARSPAVVAAFTASRAPFAVTLIPDKSLLLQRPYELLSSNDELLGRLIQKRLQRRDGRIQYVVGDWVLSLLHVLIELEHCMAKRADATTLAVLLLPVSSLQACVSRFLMHDDIRPLSFSSPLQPVMFGKQQSRLRVHCCDSWAAVTAAAQQHSLDVRVLYIPGVDTMLGCTGTADQLRKTALPRMLGSFSDSKPRLFPPEAWEQVFEHKDRTYELFGDEFMLPSQWHSLSTLADVPDVAAAMLTGRADGKWMIKGSWSWGSLTAYTVEVRQEACPQLVQVLQELFTERHQRCVCIQQFEPSLRGNEMRVFIVPDSSCPSGWRQVVSVLTSFRDGGKLLKESDFDCQQQQPTHGFSLAVAGFVDSLLASHTQSFQHAAAIGIPMLRIDCGQQADGRCFVNELGCIDQILFSAVHWQDIAHVQGKSYAEQMMKLIHQ